MKRFRLDYLKPQKLEVTASDAEEAGCMAPMDAENVVVTYLGPDEEDFELDHGYEGYDYGD